MGNFAARLGDNTSHGSPLGPGPGSPNVFICGQPAWRATLDKHLCPLVNPGGVPHGAGLVLKGSQSVFINNFPAVRMGDKIIESGPQNTILSGEPTVLIG